LGILLLAVAASERTGGGHVARFRGRRLRLPAGGDRLAAVVAPPYSNDHGAGSVETQPNHGGGKHIPMK
jgi:hypothetical protein